MKSMKAWAAGSPSRRAATTRRRAASRSNIVLWHGQNQTAEKVFNRLVTRFNAVLRGETRVAAGDEVTLRVDPTRLRAFDPATGESPAGAYTSSTSTPSAASA